MPSICPAPAKPQNVDEGFISQVEQQLGIALPDDYKALFRKYGTGHFESNEFGYLYLFDLLDPRSANQPQWGPPTDPFFDRRVDDNPSKFPALSYATQKPGMLWFGSRDGDQEQLFWYTTGSPWSIYAWTPDSDAPADRYELSITDFITQIANATLPEGYHMRPPEKRSKFKFLSE